MLLLGAGRVCISTLLVFLESVEKRVWVALTVTVGGVWIGKIETSELGTVMRSVGACPSEAQVKKIISEIDPSGTGLVEYSGKCETDSAIFTEKN